MRRTPRPATKPVEPIAISRQQFCQRRPGGGNPTEGKPAPMATDRDDPPSMESDSLLPTRDYIFGVYQRHPYSVQQRNQAMTPIPQLEVRDNQTRMEPISAPRPRASPSARGHLPLPPRCLCRFRHRRCPPSARHSPKSSHWRDDFRRRSLYMGVSMGEELRRGGPAGGRGRTLCTQGICASRRAPQSPRRSPRPAGLHRGFRHRALRRLEGIEGRERHKIQTHMRRASRGGYETNTPGEGHHQ